MNENNEKRINWKPYIIAGIISLLLGIGIFCIVYFAAGLPAVDGTAFGALILISAGGLIWVAREGFFDLASYGFRQFGNMIFSKKANQFNDFAGYKEAKRETRENRSKYYLSLLAVGALFLIATIILYIIFKQ